MINAISIHAPEGIMREFTIGKNDAGQRLDRFVAKNLPLLPPAL